MNISKELTSSEEIELQEDEQEEAVKNGPMRKKGRSKKDITTVREESKNRQKLLRSQMKDLFSELASVLRPPLDPQQENNKSILQKAIKYIRYCNLQMDEQTQKFSSQPFPSPHQLPSHCVNSRHISDRPILSENFGFQPELYNSQSESSNNFLKQGLDVPIPPNDNFLVQNFLTDPYQGFEIENIESIEVIPRGISQPQQQQLYPYLQQRNYPNTTRQTPQYPPPNTPQLVQGQLYHEESLQFSYPGNLQPSKTQQPIQLHPIPIHTQQTHSTFMQPTISYLQNLSINDSTKE